MTVSPHFTLVRLIVASTMHVPLDSVTIDSSDANLDGWDSLANAALVARLGEEFGVSFGADEIQAATSVAAIVSLLDVKIGQQA